MQLSTMLVSLQEAGQWCLLHVGGGRFVGGSWSLWGLLSFQDLLNQLFHTQLHTLLGPSLILTHFNCDIRFADNI